MDSNTVTKKNKYNLFPERTLDMNQLIKLPLPNTTDKLTIHITPIKADKVLKSLKSLNKNCTSAIGLGIVKIK